MADIVKFPPRKLYTLPPDMEDIRFITQKLYPIEKMVDSIQNTTRKVLQEVHQDDPALARRLFKEFMDGQRGLDIDIGLGGFMIVRLGYDE